MSTARIKDRFQVTIPKDVRKQVGCKVGDSFKVVYQNGSIVMTPQRSVIEQAIANLNEDEQHLLEIAQKKLDKINSDHVNSAGLSKEEIEVAVKVGLIDPEETWWYTEEWQEGEREATADHLAGRTYGPFEGEEVIRFLDKIRPHYED